MFEFKISRNYDSKYIRKIKYSIENIETSEVIGEYNTIAVKPGWFDNVLSGLWGNPGTPIICCDGKLQRTSSINKGFDLILKTIQPAGE